MSLVGVDPSGVMGCIGDSCVGSVAKFAVAFPFVYHYLGGVRHIAWDRTPDMLTTESVEKSSYLLLGSAVVVSGGLALISL
jgi:succinate dehydrogenase (ubiquinone) cytochrome b560 subunit